MNQGRDAQDRVKVDARLHRKTVQLRERGRKRGKGLREFDG